MPVYFALAERSKRIKIGTSNNPEKRLANLQIGSPESLRLVYVCDGSYDMESLFHKDFQKSRIHGEWFSFEPEIKEFLLAMREAQEFRRRWLENKERERLEDEAEERWEQERFDKWEEEMYAKAYN